MHITNIGGSLTTAVCLSLIAWSIRVLRAAKLADQKSQQPTRSNTLPPIRSNRRAFARLSPTAFWLLVQSQSIRAILVDVRPVKEREEAAEDEIAKRLDMVSIPIEELGAVLRQKNTAWQARTGTSPPSLRATIVFVSTHGHSASTAASLAMSLGFQRCAVIEGGLAAAAPLAPPTLNGSSGSVGTLVAAADQAGGANAVSAGQLPTAVNGQTAVDPSSLETAHVARVEAGGFAGIGAGGAEASGGGASDVPSPRSPASSMSAVPPDKELSRDALLLLLEYGAARGEHPVTLIDVRRHDERALYGSIRGSFHLPVEQLPKALLMPAEDWLRAFHFHKPGEDETVVVHSRGQERASLAKQLFNDAGLHRCMVLRGGVMAWHGGAGGSEDVRAYDRYAEGEIPPEPYPAQPMLAVDRVEAEAELVQKNVLLPY